MTIPAFKEALGLLIRTPALWLPGIVSGLVGAVLVFLLFTSGTFLAGRLIIILCLVILLFVTGALGIIRSGEGSAAALIRDGVTYYFQVLLPLIVIVFSVTLGVLFLMAVSAVAIGDAPDIVVLSLIVLVVSVLVLFFTFFYDAAAIFEEKKVFDSIRRSIRLVIANAGDVIRFFIIAGVNCFVVVFALMIVWEAALYDRLQPITTFNETQMASFTPDQLIAMLGQDGMYVSIIIVFVGLFITVPLVVTYKACFYRSLTKSPAIVQQMTGEYDSKGRWYKY